MVGLLADRPQRGKRISSFDRLVREFDSLFAAYCRDVVQGRVTGEKKLPSYLIREAYLNGPRMVPINAASGASNEALELVFITDEIALPVADGRVVCDVLALRRDGGRSTPVLLELKDSRQLTRLVEQVTGYAALVDQHAALIAGLFGAILGESITFDAPAEKWIVWPATGSGPDSREEELRAKGIRLVGYEAAAGAYRLRVGRKVSKAALVLAE